MNLSIKYVALAVALLNSCLAGPFFIRF